MALAELNQITQIKFTNLTSKVKRLCCFKFNLEFILLNQNDKIQRLNLGGLNGV